jgi:hypothetical protein
MQLTALGIAAVWAFAGGQVVVHAQPDGSFTGTVIRETRLADCPHAVGEQMWLGVRAQPDGQYFGGHQWFRTPACAPIAQRGNTAFRVLQPRDSAPFLRVCFAAPEHPELQPTIAPDGTSADTTAPCSDSRRIGPLPTRKPKLSEIATLPRQGRRGCLTRRSHRIRLEEPEGDALDTTQVFVGAKLVAVRRSRQSTTPIDLRRLPKGRPTVKVVATTILGERISGSRRYRTCPA